MSEKIPGRKINLQETLRNLVEAKSFKGKRKDLAHKVGIKTSALSQYETGKALPSLDTAVKLAEALDVSLDELVFGITPEAPKEFNVAPFFRSFDNTLADIQSRVTQHSWLLSEIGSLVASRIDRAADRLLRSELKRLDAPMKETDIRLLRLPTSRLPGIISDATTHKLEEHSGRSHVATTNFYYEMQIVDGQEIPGGFLPIMVDNLRKGRRYNFLFSPAAPDADKKIAHIKEHFSKALGSPRKMADLFKVRKARKPFAIGFCMYEIDTASLETNEPALMKTIQQFMDANNRVGYVIPPNRLVQGDVLVELDRMSEFSDYVKQTWDEGTEA